MTTPDREAVEMFLQEAAEHLQYLREYVSVLQEVSPRREDLERLYISAHTLSGTSGSYGFPRFSEVAAKLASNHDPMESAAEWVEKVLDETVHAG